MSRKPPATAASAAADQPPEPEDISGLDFADDGRDLVDALRARFDAAPRRHAHHMQAQRRAEAPGAQVPSCLRAAMAAADSAPRCSDLDAARNLAANEQDHLHPTA